MTQIIHSVRITETAKYFWTNGPHKRQVGLGITITYEVSVASIALASRDSTQDQHRNTGPRQQWQWRARLDGRCRFSASPCTPCATAAASYQSLLRSPLQRLRRLSIRRAETVAMRAGRATEMTWRQRGEDSGDGAGRDTESVLLSRPVTGVSNVLDLYLLERQHCRAGGRHSWP